MFDVQRPTAHFPSFPVTKVVRPSEDKTLTSLATLAPTLRLKPQPLFSDVRTLQSGFGFSRMVDAPLSAALFSSLPPCRTGLQARSSSAWRRRNGQPIPPLSQKPRMTDHFAAISKWPKVVQSRRFGRYEISLKRHSEQSNSCMIRKTQMTTDSLRSHRFRG